MTRVLHILVTRPEPDASALARDLLRRGHRPLKEPLSDFEPIEEDALPTEGLQGIIATSRNAIRAVLARPELSALLELPIFVVGPGTAAQAQAAGFNDVRLGPGDARALTAFLVDAADVNGGPFLHLAGEVLAFDMAGELRRLGFSVFEPVVYRMRAARALSPLVVEMIRSGELHGVVLMSPATAELWSRLIKRHELVAAAANLEHFCLSQRVADALAGLDAPRRRVAGRPILQELLALIDRVAATSE